MRRRHSGRIRRLEIDYLLLEVFGARYLPSDVAARIALRAEMARGLLEAVKRQQFANRTTGRRSSLPTSSMEALSAVG